MVVFGILTMDGFANGDRNSVEVVVVVAIVEIAKKVDPEVDVVAVAVEGNNKVSRSI